MKRELDEYDYQDLAQSVASQKCVLLLGPDLPVPGPDGAERNLLEDLTILLRSQVDEAKGKETFPQAAQLYGHNRRNRLENRVVDFYGKPENSPVPGQESLFRQLAEIPFHLIITSRHDRFMEQALIDVGRKPFTEDYNFQGGANEHVPEGTGARPVLYYLYGQPGAPETMVMTEDNLLEFLKAVVAGEPRLPGSLKTEFQTPGHTFLFLGFGLRNWYVRIILHAVEAQKARSQSYAVEWLPESQRRRDDNMITYYKRSFNIDLLSGDGQNFVNALSQAWRDGVESGKWKPLSTAGLTNTKRAGKRRPKVFVSYVSQDHSVVEQLVETMQRADLDPWWDKEQLRTGHDWDDELHNQVAASDYFVLLQTDNLGARIHDTYVTKEIAAALKHQQDNPDKATFILPVARGDFRVDNLTHLQTTSVMNEAEIKSLIVRIQDIEKARTDVQEPVA